MDLKALDDEEFADHERAVKMDRERRDNLARIPEQIAAMAQTYRDSGGYDADLTDAIASERGGGPGEPAAEHFDYIPEES